MKPSESKENISTPVHVFLYLGDPCMSLKLSQNYVQALFCVTKCGHIIIIIIIKILD